MNPPINGPQLEAIQAMADLLHKERLVAVIRTQTPDDALWSAQELIAAGFKAIEITFTVPQADLVIQELATHHPEILVGAGTVLDARTGIRAMSAGARFLVSPVLDEPLLQMGLYESVLVVPGAFTPTEIFRASSLGAAMIKVFPAGAAGGPEYIKAVLDPLPHLKLFPTGGVHSENFTEYLDAGAVAVGIGGNLLTSKIVNARNGHDLRHHAHQYLQKLKKHLERGLNSP